MNRYGQFAVRFYMLAAVVRGQEEQSVNADRVDGIGTFVDIVSVLLYDEPDVMSELL